MSTYNNFHFISSNKIISLNAFYDKILADFAFDVEYTLIINYSNKKNFEQEECVVFTLNSSDINTSILKLHAYVSESTAQYNVNHESYDDCIIFEDGYRLSLGITEVVVKYYTVDEYIS